MKTKVCPCCDQPIQGMYCKGCRKIVWNPVEQDIRYYLNTRHPAEDHDCTYHDDEVRSSSLPMSSSEIEAKKAEIRARMLQKSKEPRSTRSASIQPQTQTIKRSTQPDRARKTLIATITTVLVVFIILFTFVMIGVINAMNDAIYGGWGEPVPEPLATAPAIETPLENAPWPDMELSLELPVPSETDYATMEEWELTDEEVRAAGVSCNGYGHFPIVFADVVEVLRDCIHDAGYGWSMSVYSYNQFIDEYTWYETIYELTIRNEDEYAGYLNITVDTVTGEIHGMEMYTDYEKGFFEVADIAMKFLEQIGAGENLPSGTEFFETAYKNQGDTGVCLQNGLEVVCYIPELEDDYEMYRMEIYAPGYYTIVE